MTRKAMSRKLQRVVRCLSRNGNVVGMRLTKSGAGDAYEFGLRTKLIDVRASYISHSTAQAADHLEEDVAHWSLVGNASFDSFRYQLPGRHLSFLEVPVGAPVLHRGETPHAANHLEATTLQQQRFARAFLGAGQH